MSELLFNRKAQVIFGNLGADGKSAIDLRIRFKIEKTLESKPNKAMIEIYNLNADTRSIAEKSKIITLTAGYEDRVENCFIADVNRVISRDEGPDIITQFECGDGDKAFQNKTADVSFAPGTNLKDVFGQMAQKFGLPIAEVSGVKNESINNGMVVSGPIRNILDTLTERQGLEWSIQDGALQIITKKVPNQQTAILLTSDTGLIGSPKKKGDGLEVISLLQPQLKPGRTVAIKSIGIEGQFRLSKVTMVGDTHGQEWYSICEIENLNKGIA